MLVIQNRNHRVNRIFLAAVVQHPNEIAKIHHKGGIQGQWNRVGRHTAQRPKQRHTSTQDAPSAKQLVPPDGQTRHGQTQGQYTNGQARPRAHKRHKTHTAAHREVILITEPAPPSQRDRGTQLLPSVAPHQLIYWPRTVDWLILTHSKLCLRTTLPLGWLTQSPPSEPKAAAEGPPTRTKTRKK